MTVCCIGLIVRGPATYRMLRPGKTNSALTCRDRFMRMAAEMNMRMTRKRVDEVLATRVGEPLRRMVAHQHHEFPFAFRNVCSLYGAE